MTHGHATTVQPDPRAPVYMGLPAAQFLLPRFWVALVLSLPVLGLAMGEMVAPALIHRLDPRLSGWLQFALTTPVFFWSGAPFHPPLVGVAAGARHQHVHPHRHRHRRGVFLQRRRRCCSATAFPPRCAGAHGVPLYFEAAAVITTIVLIGQILEQRAHARTDAAIRALMDLAPDHRPPGARRPRGGRAARSWSCPATCCACAPARRCRSTAG